MNLIWQLGLRARRSMVAIFVISSLGLCRSLTSLFLYYTLFGVSQPKTTMNLRRFGGLFPQTLALQKNLRSREHIDPVNPALPEFQHLHCMMCAWS